MKIKNLKLESYGRFEHLDIDFAPTAEKTGNVTVIVGNNGAGKSQILQALARILDLFLFEVSNCQSETRNDDFDDNKYISFTEVRKTASNSSIKLLIEDDSKHKLEWSLKVNVSHSSIGLRSYSYEDGELFFDMYGLDSPFTEKSIYKVRLPIIASYSVNRMTDSLSDKQLRDFNFKPLDGYTDALNAQINFDVFVKWFRHREDIENAEIRKAFDILIQKAKHEEEIKVDSIITSRIMSLVSNDNLLGRNKDIQLWSTLSAIKTFLDNFDNVWIDRTTEPPTMNILKNGETLSINQLSQGEKSLLALVGDIARRLAILNPSLDDPLQGEGVVMIDEVDLHLHPKWQHDLIDKLVKTFPNVQFILTTHSPHVISDRNDILVYSLDDGELEEVPNVYGQDVNTVLTKVFDVDIRDSKVEIQLNDIRRAISHKDYPTAEKGIEILAKKMPADDLELLKCRLMLAQARVEDNNKTERDHAND